MLGRWVTSSASSPSAATACRSAAWRSCLRSVATESSYQCLQSQCVAVRAKAANHAQREICDDGVPPFRLSRENIGEVKLDEWHSHRQQRVAERQTGVSQRGGV